MDSLDVATPFAERKVVRRGLIAGLAGLGAAVALKLSGAERVDAANNDALLLGNTANVATPTGQSYTNKTRINYTTVSSTEAAFDVRHGPLANGQAPSGAHAILGVNNDSNDATIAGRNNGTGHGVLGLSVGGIGTVGSSNTGVRGQSVNTTGTGVIGVSNTDTLITTMGNGSGIGVLGMSGSGDGVRGEAASGVGVYGSSASSVGTVGISTINAGIWGQSSSNIGVVGYTVDGNIALYGTAQGNGVGVFGESVSNVGVVALAKTANVAALHAESTVAGPGKLAARFVGDVIIQGSYTATGNKSALVPHPDGSMRTLYCTEATEAYFEDFGRGQLAGGVAHVRLDNDFAPLVHGAGYHVFAMAEGDCKGLCISNQNPNGFEVRELQGGKSSLSFSYRVVAKRRDTVSERLKRVDPETVRALRQQGAPNAIANLVRPKALPHPPGLGLPSTPGPILPTLPGGPR